MNRFGLQVGFGLLINFIIIGRMNWATLVGEFVGNGEKDGLESKSFDDWVYFSCKSFSLACNQGVLRYLVLLPGSRLPFGLEWNQNNVEIIGKFGEPDKKISSKALGIEITYERFGVSIEFVNHDWNDLDNKMKSLILFKSLQESMFELSSSTRFCSWCEKVSRFRCSKCKIFNYCSRECQVSHWSLHKSQCGMIRNK